MLVLQLFSYVLLTGSLKCTCEASFIRSFEKQFIFYENKKEHAPLTIVLDSIYEMRKYCIDLLISTAHEYSYIRIISNFLEVFRN